MVFAYEITETSPYIFELSHYWTKEPYQVQIPQDIYYVENLRGMKLIINSVVVIRHKGE